MVLNAQIGNLIGGLTPDLIPGGAYLQYENGTILCLEHNMEQASRGAPPFRKNMEKAIIMKLLTYMFELMSRLKINIFKIEFYMIAISVQS